MGDLGETNLRLNQLYYHTQYALDRYQLLLLTYSVMRRSLIIITLALTKSPIPYLENGLSPRS